MGFDSIEGYVKELDNELVARPIRDTFFHLRRLFSDTDELYRTYGVKIDKHQSFSAAMGQMGLILVNLGLERTQPAFRRRHAQFVSSISERHREEPTQKVHGGALQQRQGQTSLWQTSKWAIRDEKKFEGLLAKVAALVQDLKNVTEHIVARKSTEQIAKRLVSQLDEKQLPSIERAARDSSASVLSSAASTHLQSIEARTIATASSRLSTLSFFTAPMRQQSQNQGPSKTSIPVRSTPTVDFAKLQSDNIEAIKGLMQDTEAALPDKHNSSMRRRITGELKVIMATHGDDKWWTLRPIGDRLDQLLATLRGPPDTPNQGGIFHVRLNLAGDFPLSPPKAWFVTKILHPNIDPNGAICVDRLGSNWTPILDLEKVLISIGSLLATPNWDEPVDSEHLARFLGDRSLFEAEARRWTEMYATGFIINAGDVPGGFCNTTGSS